MLHVVGEPRAASSVRHIIAEYDEHIRHTEERALATRLFARHMQAGASSASGEPSEPGTASPANTSAATTRIATYNIYFEPVHFVERFAHIVSLVVAEACDVVCLQEVPEYALRACKRALAEAGFAHSPYAACDDNGYGNMIASRRPLVRVVAQRFAASAMGRNFVHAELDNGVHVITTHLESLFANQGTRNAQQQQLLAYCAQRGIDDRVVVAGDLNSVYRVLALDRRFTPHVDQTTWFGARFNMNKRSCRFDRVYSRLACTNVHAIGTQPLPDVGCYASDHDGIVFDVAVPPPPLIDM